jgi:hypothetical protein
VCAECARGAHQTDERETSSEDGQLYEEDEEATPSGSSEASSPGLTPRHWLDEYVARRPASARPASARPTSARCVRFTPVAPTSACPLTGGGYRRDCSHDGAFVHLLAMKRVVTLAALTSPLSPHH